MHNVSGCTQVRIIEEFGQLQKEFNKVNLDFYCEEGFFYLESLKGRKTYINRLIDAKVFLKKYKELHHD